MLETKRRKAVRNSIRKDRHKKGYGK
jgi:hypothetical protein